MQSNSKKCFRFLQIRNVLNSQKESGISYQLSSLEKIITAGKKKGILGLGYQALLKYDKGKPAFMSRDWTNVLNMDVDEALWGWIWESANNISVSSELCTKCNVEVGSFIHCVWTCRYIDKYWQDVENRLQLIFDIKPKKNPMCLLF